MKHLQGVKLLKILQKNIPMQANPFQRSPNLKNHKLKHYKVPVIAFSDQDLPE